MFRALTFGINKNSILLTAIKTTRVLNGKGGYNETIINIDFLGAIHTHQPTDTEIQSMQTGSGSFSFEWFQIFTNDLSFELQNQNDKIIYNNKKYLVKSKIWGTNEYGYQAYVIVSDFKNVY
jgi:hypothetical protein